MSYEIAALEKYHVYTALPSPIPCQSLRSGFEALVARYIDLQDTDDCQCSIATSRRAVLAFSSCTSLTSRVDHRTTYASVACDKGLCP